MNKSVTVVTVCRLHFKGLLDILHKEPKKEYGGLHDYVMIIPSSRIVNPLFHVVNPVGETG
jgi:hypothetical protein